MTIAGGSRLLPGRELQNRDAGRSNVWAILVYDRWRSFSQDVVHAAMRVSCMSATQYRGSDVLTLDSPEHLHRVGIKQRLSWPRILPAEKTAPS